MAVWALTGLLAVHVYCPESPRMAGLRIRKPPEKVILELAVTATPPLPHWTVIAVPAVQAHCRDTFLPSTGTEGTNSLTPATASTERIKFFLPKSCKSRITQKKVSKVAITVGIEHESMTELTSKAGVTEQ